MNNKQNIVSLMMMMIKIVEKRNKMKERNMERKEWASKLNTVSKIALKKGNSEHLC